MAKVTVTRTFIGNPDEMKEYAGQIPTDHKKHAKRMDDAEKNSFSSVITRGTVMEVTDKRKHELAAIGVVDTGEKHSKEDPNEKTEEPMAGGKPQKATGSISTNERSSEKVADLATAEKNKAAGPNAPKK